MIQFIYINFVKSFSFDKISITISKMQVVLNESELFY